MDVFAFRDAIISDYERFSRGFTTILAEDIRQAVDEAYQGGRFWPAPLIQLNPKFVKGGWIDDLVSAGTLNQECARIFRIKTADDGYGRPLCLHKHQAEAIAIANRRESYVLTTGTGSGKSLGYFIPIVDDVLRRREAGEPCKGITAIVVYPMNALCNSQLGELKKFVEGGYESGREPVTFARYTGQESNEEKERIAKNPPDILLTNYVMLELIMTRFLETDKAVRQHAEGLRFLVLDELHSYRGRQGADVAMLVRRVRERFEKRLLCIGTSATMVSKGETRDQNAAVANFASRLFGVTVKKSNVVTETLEPVTKASVSVNGQNLSRSINAGVPSNPTHESLSQHPVAAWVEQNLGLEDQGGKLTRVSRPLTIVEASERLSTDSGLQRDKCHKFLKQFLLAAHNCSDESNSGFFAFRLHQFFSGAWNVFSTLEAPGERYLTLDGQRFKPGDRERPLFGLCFCRSCGQEYYPVWTTLVDRKPETFSPRDLTERSNDDDEVQFGYLMPDHLNKFDPGDLENQFPDVWLEFRNGKPQLKYHYRRYHPIEVQVDELGSVMEKGLHGWFIPGSFRFCLNPKCDAYFDGSMRSDLGKLSGLSSEGRSSAMSVLALSSLMHLAGTDLDEQTKKLLAFTDNRQDASLQAGHFNDFIQVLLLRGALLAAMGSTTSGYLTDEVLAQKVLNNLQLDASDYTSSPEAKGPKARDTLRTLRDVLGYRLYLDLKRGWRITSPNLEQLGLLNIRYEDLNSCCHDEGEWRTRHRLLSSIGPGKRQEIVEDLLDRMRKALCIKTIYLDPHFQEQLRNRSFNLLKEPWGLSEDERLFSHAFMVPRPRPKGRSFENLVCISHRSVFGRKLKSQSVWGANNPEYPEKFDEDVYNSVIDDILLVLTNYGYVEPTDLNGGLRGYRVNSSVLEWRSVDDINDEKGGSPHKFFRLLYESVSRLLEGDNRLLLKFEAREHTAQVDAETRREREAKFRKGLKPNGLPILFCSPTMELGVDIASLNTVHMRNVPPTPANYAQRSGRAGRSGQPALVVTYCAARSPHDQYFFSKPARMVSGAVNPPTIDLANENLICSHLQAVWLCETGVKLGNSVRDVLDMERPEELPIASDTAVQIDSPRAVARTKRRAQFMLASLESDLTGISAPWFTETWLDNTVNAAKLQFDKAFERWRSLYRATARQMESANEIISSAVAAEKKRKEAKDRYDEAFKQRNVLLGSGRALYADFYTYRYLASEGFLPGYNFPRLPLMAYIPGRRQRVARDSFLSRPRFLGLSEFGPQSIIYHEGSTYRVRRIILSVRDELNVDTTSTLSKQGARICPSCGYGHFWDQMEFERCVSCDKRLEGGRMISNLYRIEQVSTRRATRITSDEEERQRQGYEMITTLRHSERDNKIRVERVSLAENGEALLQLSYGPAATVWRINLGWRRRRNKSIYGFSVDANTGEWTKDSQAPTDAEDDKVGEGSSIERITPYVEDSRNVLMVQPIAELSDQSMVSLQYALKRGIEREHQLEEAELAAEPLPDRDNRTTILFYEAAEGGAGVLTRLAKEPTAMRQVALRALETCHYTSKSGNWDGIDDLENEHAECEAGCYRCLLSYYNQPDHDCIDRQDDEMLDFLCRLTRATHVCSRTSTAIGDTLEELMNMCTSSLEREWLQFLRKRSLRLPDKGQPYLADLNTRADFGYRSSQTLVYIDGPSHLTEAGRKADREIDSRLQDAGYSVVRFSTDKPSWPDIVRRYAWVFGHDAEGAAE